MRFSYLILSFSTALAVMSFLNLKWFFRLGILILFLSPLEIIYIKSLGAPINIGFMESVFGTDLRETTEQLTSNFVFLFFWLLLIGIYFYLLSKLKMKKVSSSYRIIFILLLLLLNAVLFFRMKTMGEKFSNVTNLNDFALSSTIQKYQKIFPYNIIYSSVLAIKDRQNTKDLENKIQHFSFHARKKDSLKEKEIYILIIGESARYKNFHLNGYPRQTSPELEKIKGLLSFSDVATGSNFTQESVSQILTRATPENMSLASTGKTIPEAFREAGFYTVWLETQNISAPFFNRIKKNVNQVFSTHSETGVNERYDTELLPQLNSIISKQQKVFLVLHTMGSHFRYSNRYPSGFEKFKPEIDRSGYESIGVKNKNELINSYDNSILFTDYFLSQVIKSVTAQEAVSYLYYLSDHGENLYDDQRELIFHSSENPTKEETHIPLLVWTSEWYEKFYPEKKRSLFANKNRKVSSISTFYTLLDMANIEYRNSDNEIKNSLSSSKYTEPVKRKLITGSKKVMVIKD